MKLKLVSIVLAVLFLGFSGFGQSESLFPARVGDQYGYINARGQMVIKPQFDSARKFSDGLALVTQGGHKLEMEDPPNVRMFGKPGYIDRTGKFVIPVGRFLFAESFSEGLAAVWFDSPCDRSCYGYIDTSGQVALPQKYQRAGEFHNGTADVRMADDKWGVIDKTGKFIIPPKYDGVFPFEDGRGVAITIVNKKKSPFDQKPSDFVTELYDRDGNVIARLNYMLFGFGNGLFTAITESGIGFVNTSSNLIIAPTFGGSSGFSEGLAAVGINKKWGYIDGTGKFVIEPTFDRALPFSEGLANVSMEGKQGYIDRTGKIVIALQAWQTYGFEDGLAFARQGEWEGYIDKTGQFVWKTK